MYYSGSSQHNLVFLLSSSNAPDDQCSTEVLVSTFYDEWIDVYARYKSTGEIRLTVAGSEQTETCNVLETMTSISYTNTYIGAEGPGDYFIGEIAGLKMYNTYLEAENINLVLDTIKVSEIDAFASEELISAVKNPSPGEQMVNSVKTRLVAVNLKTLPTSQPSMCFRKSMTRWKRWVICPVSRSSSSTATGTGT